MAADKMNRMSFVRWIETVGLVVASVGVTLGAMYGYWELRGLGLFPKEEVYDLKRKVQTLSTQGARSADPSGKTQPLISETKDTNLDVGWILGMYEWQWAGENWFGRVIFARQDNKNKISQTKVGVLKKIYQPDGKTEFRIEDRVMSLIEGSFKPVDQKRCEVDLLVRKKVRGYHTDLEQRIIGTLETRRCLAGKVQYQDHLTGKRYLGDMILVDYKSIGEEGIENWFSSSP